MLYLLDYKLNARKFIFVELKCEMKIMVLFELSLWFKSSNETLPTHIAKFSLSLQWSCSFCPSRLLSGVHLRRGAVAGLHEVSKWVSRNLWKKNLWKDKKNYEKILERFLYTEKKIIKLKMWNIIDRTRELALAKTS